MSRRITGGSVAAVETIRKRLDMTLQQFSEVLGYGASSYGDMVRRGEISLTTALAAGALMRRQAPGAESELAFVVRIVKGVPLVTQLEDAQTLVLNGQHYLLVPTDMPRRPAPTAPALHAGNGAAPAPAGLALEA